MPTVSIVIPTRPQESLTLATETLMKQTVQDFEMHIIVDSEGRGQSWARNRGAEIARGQYLLFSDNDIAWEPWALEELLKAVEAEPQARAFGGKVYQIGYAYGGYEMLQDGKAIYTYCVEPWDLETLKFQNYVSTMTLVRREVYWQAGGFDETLRRLEDWELWLRLGLQHGIAGRSLERIAFRTTVRQGVSFDSVLSHEKAEKFVREKLGIPL